MPTPVVEVVAVAAVAMDEQGAATKDANLRSGPGTNYSVAGSVRGGQRLAVTGRNSAGDWYQLADGKWIAVFLVRLDGAGAATAPIGVVATPMSLDGGGNSGGGGGGGNSAPFQCIGGCASPPDASCSIKGNVNSKKEKIYHFPDCQSYDRTDIKLQEGDRWFCTAAEAEAAGFRMAGNCN